MVELRIKWSLCLKIDNFDSGILAFILRFMKIKNLSRTRRNSKMIALRFNPKDQHKSTFERYF